MNTEKSESTWKVYAISEDGERTAVDAKSLTIEVAPGLEIEVGPVRQEGIWIITGMNEPREYWEEHGHRALSIEPSAANSMRVLVHRGRPHKRPDPHL